MVKRWQRAIGPLAAGLAAFGVYTTPATVAAQPVEYRSKAGREFRAQADTGPVARAERAAAASPRNGDALLQLGLAQAGARQYREAIATFTRALAVTPDSAARARALLLRWRGHRYISIGDFDRAYDDLTRASRLDPALYGAWYHLGIARFARGDFAGAADAFTRALPIAPDGGELAGSTDWRWMSLSRAGRSADARAHLAARPDTIPVSNAYAQRLRLYRGEIGPDAVLTPADTEAVARATLSYGVGNWYLVRGDTLSARQWFERAVQAGGWPGFGFLMSEIELRRLRARR